MKSKRKILRDLAVFFGLWWRLVSRWGYASFARFESGKDVLVSVLYRQRGRFSGAFVHTGMMAICAMGVMLTPFIASNYPPIFASEQPTPMPVVLSASTQVDPGTTIISDKPRDKIVSYVVQSGDTLSEIAQKFGISTQTILWQNNLSEDDLLKPGQNLDILPVTGVSHKVVRGDTVYSIADKYKANPQAIVDFPFNTFADDETFALTVGQVLIVPDGVMPEAPAIVAPVLPIAQFKSQVGVTPGTGQFIWPDSGVVSQYFSWYHRAIDIANPSYPPIFAADSGTVIAAGWDFSGYGNRIMIDHGNGYITLYGHLSKVLVSVGQRVAKGLQIGVEGSTGRSTGPHLHFEIRTAGGGFKNPLDFLK